MNPGRGERFSFAHNVQTGWEAHPASCSTGTGLISWNVSLVIHMYAYPLPMGRTGLHAFDVWPGTGTFIAAAWLLTACGLGVQFVIMFCYPVMNIGVDRCGHVYGSFYCNSFTFKILSLPGLDYEEYCHMKDIVVTWQKFRIYRCLIFYRMWILSTRFN
jgi:hypothetical protein